MARPDSKRIRRPKFAAAHQRFSSGHARQSQHNKIRQDKINAGRASKNRRRSLC
jgi:hypothetical protein